MERTIVPTLRAANTDAPRQRLTATAQAQQLPEGRYPELHERMRHPGLLNDQTWANYREGFRSLRARVRGVYLGSNEFPDTPHFAHEVVPLQR